MKILAIDTSSKICSVAISDDLKNIIELHNDDEKTHSVKLMPMINEAFKQNSLSLDDINLLVCSIGPGSFTGVRIGIATIKAFADVKNIPVVGVSSLESLAYNVVADLPQILSENSQAVDITPSTLKRTLICSLIDAKNENVYYGLYSVSDNLKECEQILIFTDAISVAIEKIKANTNNFDNIIFVGDGALVYKDIILQEKALTNNMSNTPKQFSIYFACEEKNFQNSISLALAGFSKYQKAQFGDSSSLSPLYLRKSQAERALEEKIEITHMRKEDIETISPIFDTQFDRFWNINNLKNDFENSNATYFVARLDDEIVGFAGFLKILDEANIMNIVTKIDKRSLGIGSKLLEKLILSAKEQNCKSITLEVDAKNYTAIHLYEKFNFKRIGLRKKYYNNTDDAILMSINLLQFTEY